MGIWRWEVQLVGDPVMPRDYPTMNKTDSPSVCGSALTNRSGPLLPVATIISDPAVF